jgi:hypothetical protein
LEDRGHDLEPSDSHLRPFDPSQRPPDAWDHLNVTIMERNFNRIHVEIQHAGNRKPDYPRPGDFETECETPSPTRKRG